MTPSPATASTPPANSSTSASTAHKPSSSPSPSPPTAARLHAQPAYPASTRASQTSSSSKPPTAETPSASSSTSCRATSTTSSRCHRLAAAKELLRRGFDSSPSHTNDEYEDHDESFDDDPGSPNYVDPNANRYNNEDDPFDFDNYDEEQFIRDRDGERALRHIYGSEEAVTIAHEAVARHRQQALFDENYVPDRDFTPIEKPEDDLYGKGHYGYNALRFAFDDNQSVGVANRIVEEFKKRMAEYDGPKDRPSCCYPGWSRDYALAAVRKSFEYPDRVEPQPDQTLKTLTPESPNWFNPRKNPGNSESREPNRAKDPPPSVRPERSHILRGPIFFCLILERSHVRPDH